MAINISVFCTCQRDGNDRRAGFHRKECRAFAALLQPAADRLPALRCKPNHTSLGEAIQCSAQCAAIWSAAMHPNNPVCTENGPNACVVVQFDLSHSINCGWDGGGYQNCICITEMINDDQRRSALWEVFQPLYNRTHCKECDQLCEPACEDTKDTPHKSKARQPHQIWPPHIGYRFRRGGWLILHRHRDILQAEGQPDKPSPGPRFAGAPHASLSLWNGYPEE